MRQNFPQFLSNSRGFLCVKLIKPTPNFNAQQKIQHLVNIRATFCSPIRPNHSSITDGISDAIK
jgi:hypothetical protein